LSILPMRITAVSKTSYLDNHKPGAIGAAGFFD